MEKIWLKQYPDGVPATINPDEFSSLTALLGDAFKQYANKPAVECMGCQLTYDQLLAKSNQFAAYLQSELCLNKGDRFAIMLPNIPQYPIALVAALQLGLIIVNVNPLYTEKELLTPLTDSGAKAIVVLANFADKILNLVDQTSLESVITTEIGDELTNIKRHITHWYLKYIKKALPQLDSARHTTYRQAMKMAQHLPLSLPNIKPADIAFLQYTGGTTGISKGAILTHRNMVANILQCIAWLDGVLNKGEEMVVTALPLYHIFSLTICCFSFMRLGACSLLIPNARDLSNLIKQLKKRPFTVFVGVNTLYQALLQQPSFIKLNFSKMKLALAGGMPVHKNVAQRWQTITGKPIIVGYGLTEASPVVSINPLTTNHFSESIGLPIPSTTVRIIDENNNQVPLHQTGELCVQGPQIMAGYWQQVKETQNVLDNDWLLTGDIAYMDEKGYLYLIDRKKDMILVSGFNVYPNEIEDVIASHPGVAEVAVIGLPSEETGESIKAFIVKKESSLTEADIKHLCRQKLTNYKQPKTIQFCSSLPKSAVGKILKVKLKNPNSIN